ncbi:MAG TPA: hypothetical protein VGO43_10975 [Pyrinomonadaceae bacterium]|jgi:hypothetical protein|nr:hypothetical protein [Pyrinomonadaceae bacterium]
MTSSTAESSTRRTSTFSWWQVPLYAGIFFGITRLMQTQLRSVCTNWIPFDCPYYWPVSIFEASFPTAFGYACAGMVVVVFAAFLWVLERKRFELRLVCVAAVILIAGTTLIQGVAAGFYAPVAGYRQNDVFIEYSLEGQEYFHDALNVTDPVDFFRRYNEIQPTLHNHGHTHPPGAILTYYFLTKLLRDPAFMSLAIMIIATLGTIYFFYKLCRTGLSESTARYMAFLLALLPAIQIYYLATLDALVAALLTGVVYWFCFGTRRRHVAGALVLLTTSFLLTFVSLFIVPVLIAFEVITKRSLKRSAIVIGGMIAIYAVLYLTTGYDAWHAFREASHYENPNGPMPLVDTANYLFTRLEDIAELLFFLGPFLLLLVVRGFRGVKFSALRERPLLLLTLLSIVSLLGMFLVGAFRTGETARACAFLYVYLLFPVGHYLEDSGIGAYGRLQLASLVFLQSVGMQIIGNYHW